MLEIHSGKRAAFIICSALVIFSCRGGRLDEQTRFTENGIGIGIAIIDQSLLTDHVEYKDRLRLYEEIGLPL